MSSKFYAQYEIYWKVIEAFHFQQIVIWPANNSNFLGKNILVLHILKKMFSITKFELS